MCDRDEDGKRIAYTIDILAAREGFHCDARIIQEEAEACDDFCCIILMGEDRERVFRHAETLWNRNQSLLIIYAACSAEDIFPALGMPFFHIVRMFDLERDLEAAVRKLGRVRLPAPDRVKFTRNGQVMLIPVREILYVESEHHDIRIHLGAEVLAIKENLSLCEEILKGRGFVRIYTSFLVNMYHIRCLEKNNVLLDNGECLYVSRRRYPEVKIKFENYIRRLDFI